MAESKIAFTKMQGLGNDFIVINHIGVPRTAITSDFARRVCDRKRGVGADQLLWLRTPRGGEGVTDGSAPDARMEIINADGSISEMCGNGLRAVALFLHLHGSQPEKRNFKIETLVGVHDAEVLSEQEIRVNMGAPQLGRRGAEGEMLEVAGRDLRFYEVSMGNPHAVFFAESDVGGGMGPASFRAIADVPLGVWGPEIERNPRFPRRTNVEFVERGSVPNHFRVVVWERGAGITEACGSGACASAVAAWVSKRVPNGTTECLITLPGGDVRVGWTGRPGDPVFLTGPAREVYAGEIEE